MNLLNFGFATYLILALLLIAGMACMLGRQARPALLHAYHGQAPVVDATVPFLVAVFCLLNLGILLLTLNTWPDAATPDGEVAALFTRLGFFFLIIAGTLYCNLHYLNKVWRDNLYAPAPPVLTR